jgi:CRP/FNR family cyclic AMP-dependent transcriptional regulator
VAGTNKMLKAGQVLFKAGDASNGMYVIRKGQVQVYLEQGGKEVKLATVQDGAIVGEMAFFENKPRSANVKAITDVEVTLITNDDFAKLLKQIPNWFVSIMQALSGRLRTTNERLQKMEGMKPAGGAPFQAVLRELNALNLLWHKDGSKEGKEFTLDRKTAEKFLIESFGEDETQVKLLIDTCVKTRFMSSKADQYNNATLGLANRGALTDFSTFLHAFVKNGSGLKCLSDTSLNILQVLQTIVQKAAYETSSVGIGELEDAGGQAQMDTSEWKEKIMEFKGAGEQVKLTKMSDGMGLRTAKKELPTFVTYHRLIAAMAKAGLG